MRLMRSSAGSAVMCQRYSSCSAASGHRLRYWKRSCNAPYGTAMRFRASDVATATGGVLVGPDLDLEGVSFDSRSVAPDQLFVAMVAERDGHAFGADAFARGAAAALVQHTPDDPGTAIVVAD